MQCECVYVYIRYVCIHAYLLWLWKRTSGGFSAGAMYIKKMTLHFYVHWIVQKFQKQKSFRNGEYINGHSNNIHIMKIKFFIKVYKKEIVICVSCMNLLCIKSISVTVVLPNISIDIEVWIYSIYIELIAKLLVLI